MVVEGLVVGCVEDWERLVSPSGVGYLVVSSGGFGVGPGFCRVALPDLKVKKPGSK